MSTYTYLPIEVIWNGVGSEEIYCDGGSDIFVIGQGEGTKTIHGFTGLDTSLGQALPSQMGYIKFVGKGLSEDNVIMDEVGEDTHITFHDMNTPGEILPDTQVIIKNTSIDDLMFFSKNFEEKTTNVFYDGDKEGADGIVTVGEGADGSKIVAGINESFNDIAFQKEWLLDNPMFTEKLKVSLMDVELADDMVPEPVVEAEEALADEFGDGTSVDEADIPDLGEELIYGPAVPQDSDGELHFFKAEDANSGTFMVAPENTTHDLMSAGDYSADAHEGVHGGNGIDTLELYGGSWTVVVNGKPLSADDLNENGEYAQTEGKPLSGTAYMDIVDGDNNGAQQVEFDDFERIRFVDGSLDGV